MAIQRGVHPSADILKAFGLGKLDDSSSGVVLDHLDQCEDCRKQVTSLSGDDFLNRLRQARGRSFTPAPAKALGESVAGAKPPPRQPAIANLPPELANHPQYHILRELGRGGMGVVYLAKNKLMDRLEVLKIVKKALLDHPGAVERFLREIRSAAKLNHANVVGAYSAVQQGELLAFAMEYVEGQDLASVVISQGPLPIQHACHYVQQAAAGLQHAFEKGMVHRDIKPQNLILAREGKKHIVKILDFGLAKATREKKDDTGLTGEGKMLGTPDYIAPEQTMDAARADIRADIYSLGCTLYYLLSGHPPFSASSLGAMLLAHQMHEAKPLNLVRPQVPEELAAVVRRMMAKLPSKRYQTPLEVVHALSPFVKQRASQKASLELSSSTAESKSAIKPVPPVTPPPSPVADATKSPPAPAAVWESLTEKSAASIVSPKSGVVRKPRAANVRERTSPKRWLIGGSIGVGVLLLALLGVGVSGVLRVKTKDGTIVLEYLPADAEVMVDGERVTVTWAGGGKNAIIHVRPGTHKVEATHAGMKVAGEEVEIAAGSSRSIVVRLQPAPSRIKNAPNAWDTKKANGLLAEFFRGQDFELKLKTRVDAQVDWNWGEDAPDPDVPADNFSVRWTGWLKAPRPGRYKLIAIADDGVRLWLDDRLLIDEWHPARGRRYAAEVELTEKPHALKLEYYERDGAAIISLLWEQQDGFADQVIPPSALFHDRVDAKAWPPPLHPRRAETAPKGKWSVQDEELVQDVVDQDGEYNPAILFGDLGWRDYDFHVKAMRTAGGDGFRINFDGLRPAVVLTAPYDPSSGPGNRTQWVIGAGGKTWVELVEFLPDGPKITPLSPFKAWAVVDKQWYDILIKTRGQWIECLLDGQSVFKISHPDRCGGKVGFECFHMAARFKDIEVTAPDGKVLWKRGPPELP